MPTAPSTTLPDRGPRPWVLAGSLLLLGAAAVFGPAIQAGVDALRPSVDPDSALFTTAGPLLLRVALPLVTVAAGILVLAPGLLLALALGGGRTPATWLVEGFALSLPVVSVAAAIAQRVVGPIRGPGFAALLATLVALAAAALDLRRSGGRAVERPWRHPGAARGLCGTILVPAAVLSALAPKFAFESMNGDASHALEAARLLLRHPLPFWPAGSGEISGFPGIADALFLYPLSWFQRLFGETDLATRLPAVLFLPLLHAAIVAVAEAGRAATAIAKGRGLIWLSVIATFLVLGVSATYDPYSSDFALPATQDMVLMILWLGTVNAHLRGRHGLTALFALLTLWTSPAGLLLLAAWLPASVLARRPVPWRPLFAYGLALGGAFLVTAALPRFLAAVGAPLPGGEHDTRELLRRFRWMLLTDVERILWMAIPCGLYPLAVIPSYRRADGPTRALLLVLGLVFLMYYAMAFVALHYFVPAMILPVVAFWRHHDPSRWSRRAPKLGLAAVLALVCVGLCLPTTPAIVTAARDVGARVDISGLPDYASMEPALFRAAELLAKPLPKDWDETVPSPHYGGAPMAWVYYGLHAAPGTTRNYLLHPASVHPEGTVRIAEEGPFALSVRDLREVERDRSLAPRRSLGRGFFLVPRELLFKRKEAHALFPTIDVRELLARAGLVASEK